MLRMNIKCTQIICCGNVIFDSRSKFYHNSKRKFNIKNQIMKN